MERESLRRLLTRLQGGELDVDSVLEALARLPFEDVDGARIDTHRALRQGSPEIIYGPGKTPEQIARIARGLLAAGQTALATRIEPAVRESVEALLPGADYDPLARLLYWGPGESQPRGKGRIAVVSAGSSDAPVAAEAAGVARRLGSKVECLEDVGVAGLHRLLEGLPLLRTARVVIAIAGMEGALPSVVGGLVDKPVVAVPTSTGYGASLGGVTALLAMLSSCASNVSVVNIDDGVSAAVVASMIDRL